MPHVRHTELWRAEAEAEAGKLSIGGGSTDLQSPSHCGSANAAAKLILLR